MNLQRILTIALAAAGLISVAGAAPRDRHDGAAPFFDPVLSERQGFCLPNGTDGHALLRYYQKLAKTELGPFPTRTDAAGDTPYAQAEPPLFENLGTLGMKVTTANPRAQAYFDQGLRLAYAFNHAEAGRAFRAARRIDPGCALCWWGEALVLGPNINAPMEARDNASALSAVAQARQQAPRATAKEQALIAALAQRYSADPKAERTQLDAAYAAAMAKVAARFPDDDHVQTLYAESLMDLQPWDYWDKAGTVPKGHTSTILAALERVLARNPDHAGAIHFCIHMTEASSDPGRAEPHARRLAAAMPGAGHLVHMPFHTLFRIGRYKDALAANVAAVAADEAYLRRAAPEGLYPAAYYPHNVHSLMVSAQMAGDGRSAIAAADKLADIVSDEAARSIAWVQPIKVAPYFAHAQFSPAQSILALPDPGFELPYVRAMWHYARGVALATSGQTQAAEREAAAIVELARTSDFSSLEAGGVPARDVLALARHVVLARIAQSREDYPAARAAFESAIEIEDRLAYSEPPYWYYPVRQSLGALLLEAGQPAEAEQVFRASLARVPSNGWALWGMSQAHAQQGRAGDAAAVQKLFEQAWAGEASGPDLSRL